MFITLGSWICIPFFTAYRSYAAIITPIFPRSSHSSDEWYHGFVFVVYDCPSQRVVAWAANDMP
jgi:hypothetical protein